LTRVDLPALGRPTIATKPDLKGMEELIVRLWSAARKAGACGRDVAEEVKRFNAECTEKGGENGDRCYLPRRCGDRRERQDDAG
jgi:hypothetical protein